MSKTSIESCLVFAGPTLHGIDESLLKSSDYTIVPPIKRGDIEQLVSQYGPSTLAIVDGVFHAHPAVGHSEILSAITAGWRVWGLSSMGAIRACEMREEGMLGFGEVYQRFSDDLEFSDDEVTLVHEADPPFFPMSEPLIHIRHYLETLTRQNIISPRTNTEITLQLKNMWYGHRTLKLLHEILLSNCVSPITLAHEKFHNHRIKTSDLEKFLTLKPWTGMTKHNATFRNIT